MASEIRWPSGSAASLGEKWSVANKSSWRVKSQDQNSSRNRPFIPLITLKLHSVQAAWYRLYAARLRFLQSARQGLLWLFQDWVLRCSVFRSLGVKPEFGKLAWNLQRPRLLRKLQHSKLLKYAVRAELATWQHVLHLSWKAFKTAAWLLGFICVHDKFSEWCWDSHHDFQLIRLQLLGQHTPQPVPPKMRCVETATGTT